MPSNWIAEVLNAYLVRQYQATFDPANPPNWIDINGNRREDSGERFVHDQGGPTLEDWQRFISGNRQVLERPNSPFISYFRSGQRLGINNPAHYFITMDLAAGAITEEQADEVYELIERLVDDVNSRVEGYSDISPQQWLRFIHYAMRNAGIRYNHGADDAVVTSEIVHRTVQCDSFTLLVWAVAYELNLPVHGVPLPEHMAVRGENEDGGVFIFDNDGSFRSEGAYLAAFPMSGFAISEGVYFNNMTADQLLAYLHLSSLTVLCNGDASESDPMLTRHCNFAHNRIVALNPNSVEACLIGGGDIPVAIQSIERAIALNDRDPLLHRRLAVLYGLNAIQQFINDESSSSSLTSLRLGREQYLRAAELSRELILSSGLQESALLSVQYEGLLSAYQGLIGSYEAESILEEEEHSQEMNYYTREHQRFEELVEHYQAGMTSYNSGDYQTAIAEAQAALELDPENPYLYYSLGRIYLGAGQIQFAHDSLEIACRLNGQDAGFLFALAHAHFRLAQADPANSYSLMEGGLRYLQSSLDLDPNNDETYRSLGDVYFLLHDEDVAEGFYRETLGLNEDNEDALMGLARILSTRRDYFGAIDCLERVLDIDEDNAYAQYRAAMAYFELGVAYHDEYEWHLERALELSPKIDS